MTQARDLGDAANKANFLDNVSSDIQTQVTANATAASNAVLPAGLILPFGNTTAPTGYLACEGQEVLQSAYPALYAAIGTAWGTASSAATHFKLPDLRAEFLRGWDNGRGIDSGRSFASTQGHALQQHNHGLEIYSGAGANYRINNMNITSDGGGGVFDSGDQVVAVTGHYGTFASETRPRNIAILWCIKT